MLLARYTKAYTKIRTR